ncbi:MAG: hypothetical protein DIU83_03850 [Bacillota bacterium]|nr:MAG: hypothetical protein DIU83_03850 [Bacillota bacterium]
MHLDLGEIVKRLLFLLFCTTMPMADAQGASAHFAPDAGRAVQRRESRRLVTNVAGSGAVQTAAPVITLQE